MKKILLIIQREYLMRVRKKSFILTTLLLPVLYALLIFGSAYIAKKSATKMDIGVADKSGLFTPADLKAMNNDRFTFHAAADSAEAMKFDAGVVIPISGWKGRHDLNIITKKNRGFATEQSLKFVFENAWATIKNRQLGITEAQLNDFEQSKITVNLKPADESAGNGSKAGGMGQVAGFLIYFILLIYGSQVMMGVMEEKTNRIAEVVVSSVKPLQLMLGKIIGIGLVAITQFLLWILLMLAVYNIAKAGGTADGGAMGGLAEGMQNVFKGVNLPLILTLFLLYFIGGFFFYASLYAAIGSAVNEDIRDAQSLSFPVTMLVIFSLLVAMAVSDNPGSPMAFWGSMIPFSSPIVMMARIPYGVPAAVPWWQLILSLAILYASIVAVAWVSGKIYRTGILMYGKKVTLKEMLKWIVRKQ